MSLKRGVAVIGLFLAAAWLVSCGMNSEEKRLAAAINQALQTRDLGYWQVDDLDIQDRHEHAEHRRDEPEAVVPGRHLLRAGP